MHQGGALDRAEALYQEILKIAPAHFDALHLLGVLRQQQGRSQEALRLIAAALRCNAASADALSNHGVVLEALDRPAEAVASYDKALALKPGKTDALSNRGNALRKLGRSSDALASCEAALALNPNFADALGNRGQALAALGRYAEAVASFDRALALAPRSAGTLAGRAASLIEVKRYDDALCSAEQALAIDPRHVAALAKRGNALFLLGCSAEALASYDAALVLAPHDASILNNRGYALLALGRPDDALASYQAALACAPDYVEAIVNCGNVLAALDRNNAAEAHYDKALALAPGLSEAQWNKSLLYLSHGRFAQGWALYEHRWSGGVKGAAPRSYPQPRWNGETMDGTLLVWGEQGLGDQILHASMVPELPQRVDSVVLEVEPRLVPLFARSFPEVRVVALAPDLHADHIDAHAPLGGLGEHLRPSPDAFPAREYGYLAADSDRTEQLRARLSADGRKVIGLSWRSVAPLIGNLKSAALRDFEPLLRMPNCRFVDLQYGDTRADREAIARELGLHVERLDDIDPTNDIDGLAALMAACDLVATVSNTTAHLAGALGRPTFVFVPFGNARIWYWFKHRTDCPWYPHVRLCRQAQGEPWGGLIASSTPAISGFLSGR